MPYRLMLSLALASLLFLTHNPSLENGRRLLANLQFEAAKKAFNEQDYFQAERLSNLARLNAPDSAAPYLLIGNCFYLQGQDSAAMDHYSTALKLDPGIGHIPPFFQQPRAQGSRPVALHLKPAETALLHK